MKKRVDLLALANKRCGFQFHVHNQGTEESCVSHAFTSAHEIFIEKHLNNDDLLAGTAWMTEMGALMMDMAQKIETIGQRELQEEVQQEGRRAKRFCRAALKLAFDQIPLNIAKCKSRLLSGKPIVVTVKCFTRKPSPEGLVTSSGRDDDEYSMGPDVLHAICIYGFVENENDEGGGRFLIVNSHGIDWGENGKGAISFRYFQDYTFQVWAVR